MRVYFKTNNLRFLCGGWALDVHLNVFVCTCTHVCRQIVVHLYIGRRMLCTYCWRDFHKRCLALLWPNKSKAKRTKKKRRVVIGIKRTTKLTIEPAKYDVHRASDLFFFFCFLHLRNQFSSMCLTVQIINNNYSMDFHTVKFYKNAATENPFKSNGRPADKNAYRRDLCE